VGLVFGSLLLFLVGTNIQSGWVFILSALLLGVAAAGAVLPFGVTRGLTISRRAPGETFVGDPVRVDLTVSNPTRRPRLSISIRDPHVAETNLFLPSLGTGASVTISTRRTAARRGVVDGGPVVLSSGAPFGVAEVRRIVPATGRTVVFPRIVPFPDLRVSGDPSTAADDRVPYGRGPGREFHGIREYQHGDSLRHVHWPSTARHGSLVVREFERERPARLTVVVDTAGDTPAEDDAETALDRCCSVAASAVLEALRLGHGVTLVAGRGGRPTVLEDVERMPALTMLAELRAPGGMALPSVLAAVPSAPTTLVAFPTWRSNAAAVLAPAVERLVAAGSRVVAVAIEVAVSRAEPALAEGEADELLAVLAAAGAEPVRIRPGRAVEDELASAIGGAAR
jgi:uncharacterized protein (DUF58 family)